MPEAKDLDISEPQSQAESVPRILALLASRVPSGAASNFVSPEGTPDDILSRVYHSGAVQGALSFAGGAPNMIHSAADAVRGIPYVGSSIGRILAGPPTDDPNSVAARQTLEDFADRHGAEAAASRARTAAFMEDQLGVPKPVTPLDHIVAGGAETAGTMVFPTGVSKLPGAAGNLLKWVLPSAEGWKTAGPLMGTVGAGANAAEIIRNQGVPGHISESPRTEPAPANSGIESLRPLADTLPQAGPDGKPVATPPMPEAGQPTAPFGGGSAAAAAPVSQLTYEGKQYTLHPPAEDQTDQQDPTKIIDYGHSQGSSSWTVGGAWTAAAVTGTAAWLSLRYGGKGIAHLADAGRAIAKEGPAALLKPIPNATDRIAEANRQIIGQPLNAPTRGVSVPSPASVNPEVARFRTAVYDSWDETNRIGDAINQTPAARAQWRAYFGTVMNDAALDAMHVSQARTGVRHMDGATIQAFDDYKRAEGALPKPKQDAFSEARFYANELDTRRRLAAETAARGAPATINDRVSFAHLDDAQLTASINATIADPEILRVWNMSQRNIREGMQSALAANRITQAEYHSIMQDRPNYLSSFDTSGKVIHALGPRDLRQWGGANEINMRAIQLDEQHYYALYKEIAQNRVMGAWVDRALQMQRRDPTFPKLFTENRLPNGRPAPLSADVPSYTFYDASGPRHVRVNHPGLFHAMNANVGQLSAWGNVVSSFRRWRQTGSTGLLAMFGGRGFPLVNLPRNIVAIAAQARPEAYRGVMDKFIRRRVEQGKFTAGITGYKGVFDPLSIAGTGYQVGANLTAGVFAKRMADLLHPDAVNWFNAGFRNLKTDAYVNTWHKALESQYRMSVLGKAEAEGVVNVGSRGGLDPKLPVTGKGLLGGDRTNIFTPGHDTAPSVYRGRLGSLRVNSMGIARDTFNAVNDAAHTFHFRINMDNPRLTRETLAHEARSVTGDPAVRGSSPWIQGATNAVDYANTSLQASDALLRAYERTPFQTGLGAAFTYTVGAAASIFSMLAAGSWAINHGANLLSNTQRANAMTFYHQKEGSYSTISLEQGYATAYPIIHESLAALVGAWQVHEGEPEFDRLIHSLADMFSHHVSYATWDATGKAFANSIDIAQMPGIGNALIEGVSTAGGHPIRAEWHSDQIIHNIANGRTWYEGLVHGTGVASNVPDQSHADGGIVNVVINNLIGVAAKAMTDVLDPAMAASYENSGMTPTERVADLFTRSLDNYYQIVKDGNPAVNILWDNQNMQSTNTPLATGVQRAMANVREVTGMSSDLRYEGLTGKGGEEIIGSQDKTKLPTDPIMFEMYRTVGLFGKQIAEDMKKIQDYREVMDNAKMGEYYSEDKRAIMNNQAAKIQQAYERAAAKIDQLNSALSYLANGRMVDIRKKPDWKGTIEQFPMPVQ